jgi:peptidoglycan/xylan/chitin deacetylase (PgdA/CDA1 family)
VSFILNYEEGGERSWQDGDNMSEPYLWEKGSGAGGSKPGGRYLNSEQDFEYGSRVGCWRIMRLMKEFGWKMTIYAIAKAMERNQGFAKACVREGHEIAAHGMFDWLFPIYFLQLFKWLKWSLHRTSLA